MTPISTTTSPGIAAHTVGLFMDALEKGMLDGILMVWQIVISLLKEHLFLIALVVLLLLAIALFKAMMGRWGMLGSVLYNLLYATTLLLIGFIWGPEVFVNDYFNLLCAVLLYPICYLIVGSIPSIIPLVKPVVILNPFTLHGSPPLLYFQALKQ